MIVNIDKVIACNDTSRWNQRRMVEVLKRQGQIEPLQVQHYAPGVYITFHDDPYGNDIVWAARELEWPTLLVVVMKRYEG
jgi:hypothetical protein